MKNEFYKSPEPKWLMKQFWKAAGADQYLLSRSTYSDQVKYFCLGGIVVATGVMAALAGGYAFYTIFEPKGDALEKIVQATAIQSGEKSLSDYIHYPTLFLSAIFGLMWGAIIFNIDRFIVTSTGKGDGTEAITGQEIRSSLPRIIMGMIIALTISKPVEIRMFKSELDERIGRMQKDMQEEEDNITKAYYETQYYSEIDSLIKVEKASIKYEYKKVSYQDSIVKALQKDYTDEVTGRNGNGADEGPRALAILTQKNQEQEVLNNETAKYALYKDDADSNVEELKKERKEHEVAEAEEKKQTKKRVSGLDGLLIRLKLSHEVAGFWISLFITLLFMVIELTPIFFKMMLTKGPYDYMDDNIKELARAENGIEIEYDFFQDKKGMERHRITNHYANKLKDEKIAMIKAQTEMNLKVIEEWKKKELGKIEVNPDDYFESE